MDLFRLDAASWLRNALAASGLYLLGGAGAVTFWRSTGSSPGAGELALWLLGVPTLAVLALGGFWRWRAAGRERNTAAGAAAAGGAEGTSPDVDACALRATPLAITASALWVPAGREAGDVVDALRQHRRPRLHPALRDLHGFPVTVADVEGIGDADAGWAMDAVEAADDALRRAMALLRPVAEDLLLAALPEVVPERAGEGQDSDAGPGMHPYAMHHSQSVRARQVEQRATLRIVLLTPALWSESGRAAAVDALDELAASLGHDPSTVETLAYPIHSEAETWQTFERLAETLRNSPVRDDRALVLAADSSVTEAVVEHLHSTDRLLRSGAPEGEVPGEGAAGVLLAALDPSAKAAVAPPPAGAHAASKAGTDADAETGATVHLHLPSQARLTQTTRTREAARISGELIARTLADAGCDPSAGLQVVTTADHRPSRMTEAATALVAQCPDLDPVEDALHLGVACGSLGVAGPLALLAVAAAHARDTATPTLACALADARTRAVALLSPAPPPPLPPSPPRRRPDSN